MNTKIEKENLLIAEFMGGLIVVSRVENVAVNLDGKLYYARELNYYNSLDEILPVVRKIVQEFPEYDETEVVEEVIISWASVITDWEQGQSRYPLALFNSVVRFIVFFNSTQKQKQI